MFGRVKENLHFWRRDSKRNVANSADHTNELISHTRERDDFRDPTIGLNPSSILRRVAPRQLSNDQHRSARFTRKRGLGTQALLR
jgi:hypothetical protein